jgi:D-sedoheptulose 7-phosphate isomerase
MNYIKNYFAEVTKIADLIDKCKIEKMIKELKKIRKNRGRLFFLGVGGGASNASHAVNDFRKICGFEAYTPMDNISELSARVNDEGWESIFVNWLKGSRLCNKDGVFAFSVGGGHVEKKISVNLVEALKFAKKTGAKIFGIVGRDGGYAAQVADVCVIIPQINSNTVTPHTESFQAVVWHLIVSHPEMKACEMKWESIK